MAKPRNSQSPNNSGTGVGCIVIAVVAAVVLIAFFRVLDAVADRLGISHFLMNALGYGGALLLSLVGAGMAKRKK